MNILAITWAFVPIQCPATYRLLKWFKYLSEAGHTLTVLSVDRGVCSDPRDPWLDSLVPGSARIIRIKSAEHSLVYRLLARADSWLVPLFQPNKKPWYRPALRAIRGLPLETYDVVMTCSQPPVCHLLGYKLRTMANLPWVAYFSDPWSLDPYNSSEPPRIRTYNLNWERRVIATANLLVYSSLETRSYVMQDPTFVPSEKAEVLDHCFVPEWFHQARSEEPAHNGLPRIVLTGNFYGKRTAIPFLQMLSEHRRSMNLDHKVHIDLYGTMSDSEQLHPLWNSLKNVITFHGRINYRTSLAIMQNSDVLLLIDAPVEQGDTSVFFPSKLAEYIGSGRPIVGFTPVEGATARILREIGEWAVDVNNPKALVELLGKIIDGNIRLMPNTHLRAKYHYRNTGKQLEDILSRAIALHNNTEIAEQPRAAQGRLVQT